MNITKITALAGAAAMALAGILGTTAASAAPASARGVPVIYLAFGNWQGPGVEPSSC